MVDAVEFLGENIPAPAVLVDGLIHTGTKIALGGASKAMKTWTQMLMALCVSHGIPLWGRKTIKSRVLIVKLEVPRHFCQQRIAAIAKSLHIKMEKGQLTIWNLRGKAASHQEIIPKIRAKVGTDFGLIIIDPIYKMYGDMDENSASNVGMLLNSIEDLSVQSGAAVSISAHFSKGNQSAKESIDRISGSGVFARDPDTLLIFTKHEEDDCFTVEATLRNFPPADPFVVRWHHPLMILDDLLDPARLLKRAGGSARKYTIENIIQILEIGVPLSTSELVKELGCNRRTFYSSIHPMLQKHPRVVKAEKGWTLKDVKI